MTRRTARGARMQGPARRARMHAPARRRRRRLVAAATAALGLALAFAPALALAPALSASAHDYPVTWSPKPGSTVTTPLKKVSITFDDIVLDLSGDSHTSLLEVIGPKPATRHFETACTTTLGRTISTPVAMGAPGTYTIAYQIVSADGHVVSGKATFHYAPPAGTPAAQGTAQPVCTEGGPNATASPAAAAPVPGGASASTFSPLDIVVTIVTAVIVLAVAAIVVVLVTSQPRSAVAPGTRAPKGGSMGVTADSAAGREAGDGTATGGRRGKPRWRPDADDE